MSKIKTGRVEPRTPEGTLVLGSENGTVMFEGTVVMPAAYVAYVDEKLEELRKKLEAPIL